MDVPDLIDGVRTVTPLSEIFIRLLMAAIFGAVIGLDREYRQRPAGLRTHILVSLAAAVFTVITFELFYQIRNMDDIARADPIRLIEAVTAGVAFLAAGTIIQSRGQVKGITTGASMWMAGAIGVACGGGFYTIAVLAMIFAVAVLVIIGWIEHKYTDKSSG